MATLVSYHGGHSIAFCDHAEPGTLEHVVQVYIKKGFRSFGLTEHQPRPEGFLYDEEKEKGHDTHMIAFRFMWFIDQARRLQSKYSEQADILVGFETEFCDEGAIDLIKDLRGRYNLNYIVGSVHHVNGVAFDFSKELYQKAIEKAGSLENLYRDYYEQQYRLIKEAHAELIGRPDLRKPSSPNCVYTPTLM